MWTSLLYLLRLTVYPILKTLACLEFSSRTSFQNSQCSLSYMDRSLLVSPEHVLAHSQEMLQTQRTACGRFLSGLVLLSNLLISVWDCRFSQGCWWSLRSTKGGSCFEDCLNVWFPVLLKVSDVPITLRISTQPEDCSSLSGRLFSVVELHVHHWSPELCTAVDNCVAGGCSGGGGSGDGTAVAMGGGGYLQLLCSERHYCTKTLRFLQRYSWR